ncbi:MAG: ABC transporter ATP-binding protein [Bacteroidales bacterium]
MAAIHIDQLQKQYGDQFSLEIDNLHITPGTLTAVVGNNGAGKTTLFRLMLDLLQPTNGSIAVEGKTVSHSEHWKPFTGSYLDEGFLVDFLTPEEYFCFTGRLHGLPKETVDERLAPFHKFMAGEVLGQKKYIRNLSTGNKQKVGIMAAMLTEPRLLILDEPFNYLDPSSQIMIKRMLKADNEARQTTMLISSHNLNHLTEICSRILLLENGRIIKDLSSTDDNLQEVERYFSARAE